MRRKRYLSDGERLRTLGKLHKLESRLRAYLWSTNRHSDPPAERERTAALRHTLERELTSWMANVRAGFLFANDVPRIATLLSRFGISENTGSGVE